MLIECVIFAPIGANIIVMGTNTKKPAIFINPTLKGADTLKKIIPIISVFIGVRVVIIDARPLSISVWPKLTKYTGKNVPT